jgi:hypothetical protein
MCHWDFSNQLSIKGIISGEGRGSKCLPRPLPTRFELYNFIGHLNLCFSFNPTNADGNFVSCDSSEDAYSPSPIMNEAGGEDGGGVVVVTVSFRVGPFGFLCLGNEDVPGNMVGTCSWSACVFDGDKPNVAVDKCKVFLPSANSKAFTEDQERTF